MKNDGVIIDVHTSDARTIENENNEQSLQGYKTPCGLFLVDHTLELAGVAHRCVSGG